VASAGGRVASAGDRVASAGEGSEAAASPEQGVTAARVARTGAVAAAVIAAVAGVLTAVLKPDAFDAFCHVGLATCTPRAEPHPSAPASAAPVPAGEQLADGSAAGKSGAGTSIEIHGGNSTVTGSGNSTANSTAIGSGDRGGKSSGRGGKDFGKTGTGTGTGTGGTGTGTQQPPPPPPPSPAPTETPWPGWRQHDGPHTGRVGWQPDIATDVDDVGFRSGADFPDGQIRATEAGLQSVDGVRMTLVRGKANVGYPRCEAPPYDNMVKSIAASKIQVDDYICADDGAQYVAAYRINALPGPGTPYYKVVGTSYARY
jgi:hypothetical protein